MYKKFLEYYLTKNKFTDEDIRAFISLSYYYDSTDTEPELVSLDFKGGTYTINTFSMFEQGIMYRMNFDGILRNIFTKLAGNSVVNEKKFGQFRTVLMECLNSSKHDTKYVDNEEQFFIASIFNPRITTLDNKHIITDDEYSSIIDKTQNIHKNDPKKIYRVLIVLATIATRLTCEDYLDNSGNAPQVLRVFAAALLYKARQVYPQGDLNDQIDEWIDELNGNNCTEVLSRSDMHKNIKQKNWDELRVLWPKKWHMN